MNAGIILHECHTRLEAFEYLLVENDYIEISDILSSLKLLVTIYYDQIRAFIKLNCISYHHTDIIALLYD